MEFRQKILDKLASVFKKHDLQIFEQQSNYLSLKSQYIVIIIVYNQFENSNTFWLGRNGNRNDRVEIDNDIIRTFFNSDLKLSQVPVDVFINNLLLFFENEAEPLLRGDISRIIELEKFNLARSQKYTHELLDRQNLAAANRAWENGNYKEYIRIIDQINEDKLPSSYRLKYKIASKKV